MGQMDPSFSYVSQSNRSSVESVKKILSREELYAIFDEIITVWFQEEWLFFDEEQRKTFLTLQCSTTELLTVQMAIDQSYLTSGDHSLLFEPECLLVRSKAKSKSVFFPNSTLSLENLADVDDTDQLHPYHLLAIICHSAETNSKLMFYKHARTNTWYIYYDQSIVSSPHSNLLNADEQQQLESFIVQENSSSPLHLLPFTYLPLSALHNHPVVYVYLPERKKKKRKDWSSKSHSLNIE